MRWGWACCVFAAITHAYRFPWYPLSHKPTGTDPSLESSFYLNPGPTRVSGVFPSTFGLQFDGVDDELRSSWLQITGNSERTVSLWFQGSVNVGVDNALISWGAPELAGGRFTVKINTDAQTGSAAMQVFCAVRVEIGGASIVGDTSLCTNSWRHIAVVLPPSAQWDGSLNPVENIQIWVDGRQNALTHLPTTATLINTRMDTGAPTYMTSLSVGVYWRSGNPVYFTGALDELRIYSTALTGTQIATLGGATFSEVSGLSPWYWPLDGGATDSWSIQFEQFTGDARSTPDGVAWPSTQLQGTAGPVIATALKPSIPLATLPMGANNGYAAFDGMHDVILTGCNDNALFGAAARTFSMWVKHWGDLAALDAGTLLSYGNSGQQGQRFSISLNSRASFPLGALRVEIQGRAWVGTRNLAGVSDCSTESNCAWHHVVVALKMVSSPTLDNLIVWIDGAQETPSSTSTATIINTRPSEPFTIGSRSAITNGQPKLLSAKGWIDDVRVYSATLDQTDVTWLYSGNGSPVLANDWTTLKCYYPLDAISASRVTREMSGMLAPTPAPTPNPTNPPPTPVPTSRAPTPFPTTRVPTPSPSEAPSNAPTSRPTPTPTTRSPSQSPTRDPPTPLPTMPPTSPTNPTTAAPSRTPTIGTWQPTTPRPTNAPTPPTPLPTPSPTRTPSAAGPTTRAPSSRSPTESPTVRGQTRNPTTNRPTVTPTTATPTAPTSPTTLAPTTWAPTDGGKGGKGDPKGKGPAEPPADTDRSDVCFVQWSLCDDDSIEAVYDTIKDNSTYSKEDLEWLEDMFGGKGKGKNSKGKGKGKGPLDSDAGPCCGGMVCGQTKPDVALPAGKGKGKGEDISILAEEPWMCLTVGDALGYDGYTLTTNTASLSPSLQVLLIAIAAVLAIAFVVLGIYVLRRRYEDEAQQQKQDELEKGLVSPNNSKDPTTTPTPEPAPVLVTFVGVDDGKEELIPTFEAAPEEQQAEMMVATFEAKPRPIKQVEELIPTFEPAQEEEQVEQLQPTFEPTPAHDESEEELVAEFEPVAQPDEPERGSV